MDVLGHGLPLPLNRQSLDLATGPLVNFGGASAAYSLRDLNGRNPRVVRVRRASDNSERDFYEDGVNSGELVNWVNAQIVPPLDVRELVDGERTGALIPAAAAYSLRNLSTSYTGNVVDVRRSSDDTEDSFTAAEVADGTLTTWVNTDVNLYTSDFSVDADGLTSSNGTLAGNIDGIDGVDDTLRFALSGGDTSHTVNVSVAGSGLSYTLSFDYYIPSANTALDGIDVKVASSSYTSGILNVTDTWTTVNLTLTPDATGTLRFRTLDGGSATPDGDGDVVYIKNIVFTQTTADGFVTQWYDQSGNGNHANQANAASQPKIVDAGSLVRDSKNNPAIDFDGIDDKMDLTSSLAAEGAYSFIAYHEFTAPTMIIKGNLNVPRIRPTSNVNYQVGSYSPQVNQDFSVASTLGLVSVLKDASHNARVYANGTESSSGQKNVGSGSFPFTTLGTNINSGAGDGKIVELIYYTSDQSANRTAFEANIGETYGIDLPSGVDTGYDEVDGFVETWYDQSGNGNDAVQETASNQPKIVDAGVLVSGGLDFDGVDDDLDLPQVITSIDSASSFVVAKSDTTSSTRTSLSLSRNAPNAARFYTTIMVGGSFYFGYGSSTTAVSLGAANTDRHLFAGIADASTAEGFIDGVSGGSIASSSGYSPQNGGIGSVNATTFWSGQIQEIIIYDSDQSANRAAIETNINNQYDIY